MVRPDNVLVAIIHSSEYDMEKARQTATAHFGIRFSLPEIFEDLEFDSDCVQNALEVGWVQRAIGFNCGELDFCRREAASLIYKLVWKIET